MLHLHDLAARRRHCQTQLRCASLPRATWHFVPRASLRWQASPLHAGWTWWKWLRRPPPPRWSWITSSSRCPQSRDYAYDSDQQAAVQVRGACISLLRMALTARSRPLALFLTHLRVCRGGRDRRRTAWREAQGEKRGQCWQRGAVEESCDGWQRAQEEEEAQEQGCGGGAVRCCNSLHEKEAFRSSAAPSCAGQAERRSPPLRVMGLLHAFTPAL